ncbi:MAG TPA: TldD/PmbA family protein [Candidatus Polarisedimenticolia bacterium]|jgi:TldD protein|nr:TldD/PmbA family protein [Candidatus Polarisedimenticolia bacterium]
MNELAALGLEAARSAGAGYADVRINRYRNQRLAAREDHLTAISDEESYGMGIRVLVKGTWGFAASSRVTREEVPRVAALAVATAKANVAGRSEAVRLVPVERYEDVWQTPYVKDPFEVPLDRKVELLLAINREALRVKGAKYCSSSLHFVREDKSFASTAGTLLSQTLVRCNPAYTVTAVDGKTGRFATRSHDIPPAAYGYEYVEEAHLADAAGRIAEEAVQKLRARPAGAGRKDLVLHPSNLWLTIHESVGHPTELDRALGYEANFAGTSFATPDKLGKLRFGSPRVNFIADRILPGGLATVGYDDDGVKARRWHLVKDGLFVDYQTTREQARWIGQNSSKGCAHADSWASIPFQRMPNVSLLPGTAARSAEELIAEVKDGIYIVGDGSYSIDQQRYNFQFSGQSFREIRDGKLGDALRDLAYQSNTTEFWNACDGLGGPETWMTHGTFYDGKGEPGQVNAVSHASPVARFRGINVLSTERKL